MRGLAFALLFLFSASAFAQSPRSVSALMGNVIPSGPDGVTEIFGVGGIRYSTQGEGASQTEFGAIFGSAGPILWNDLFLNSRFNMPNRGFTSHIGAGIEWIRYRSAVEQTDSTDALIRDANGNPILGEVENKALGLHLIGGISTSLIDPLYIRSDIKFNVTPALILTISIGLEWRFGKKEATTTPPAG